MKKIILPLSTALILISLAAFSLKEKLTLQTGTYGVCPCEPSDANSSEIALTLNDDHTFRYSDQSNPKKKINLSGNWELTNNTILLKNYTTSFAIHDKWTIDKNEKCIKSRVGLNYCRLCNVSACK